MAFTKQPLDHNVPIVDTAGLPTPQFQRAWQDISNVAQSGGVPPGYYVRTGMKNGWSNPTGTATRTAFSTYPTTTAAGSYSQAQMQGLMDEMKAVSERLKAVIDDLIGVNLFVP